MDGKTNRRGREGGMTQAVLRKRVRWLALVCCLMLGLSGCALPQVQAMDRLFLPLTATVLATYDLPPQTFADTTVGGISALAYDPRQDILYALSDDGGKFGPPRVYTLALTLSPAAAAAAADDASTGPPTDAPTLTVTPTGLIPLTDAEGQPYPANTLDPEGLALSPRQTLIISAEGPPPTLREYDLASGQLVTDLRLPARFLPNPAADDSPQGVQANLGPEALTLAPPQNTGAMLEPFRLFTAAESALFQDYDDDPSQPLYCRFLHYLIGQNQSTLIAEHIYPLDLEPTGAVVNGLTELLSLDAAGHFLALERAYGLQGFQTKLYQTTPGGATDTSPILSLQGNLDGLVPMRKRLLMDLHQVLPVDDNFEGMTLGPPLADGSPSLLLVSDNNFQPDRPTRLVLLGLSRTGA